MSKEFNKATLDAMADMATDDVYESADELFDDVLKMRTECEIQEEHDRLTSENARLLDALVSVVKLQKKHYGDGMSTHLAMITKAHEIEQLLTELEKGDE